MKCNGDDAVQKIAAKMAGPATMNMNCGRKQSEAEAPLDRHKRAAETVKFLMKVEKQLRADIIVAQNLNGRAFCSVLQ